MHVPEHYRSHHCSERRIKSDAMRQIHTGKHGLLLATALSLCQIASLASAANSNTPPAASPAQVKSLIAQLGDASFAVREAATTRLAGMDVSIRPALQE